MKVADLQKTVLQLCELFESAGGAKPVGELRAFVTGLDKFKDQTLGSFTTLLGRMSETGEVVPKQTKTKQTSSAKPPAEDAGAVAIEAKRLYDHAAQGIDEKELVSLRERLARLTGEGLKVVAKELNFTPTSKEKAKANLVDAIVRKIEKREGATIRRNVIDRPDSHAIGNGMPLPTPAPVS